MEAVCCGVPAPFLPNASVSAVTASHPFGGGNAGERMDSIAIEVALRATLVLEPYIRKGEVCGTLEFTKSKLQTVARAITQLWGDVVAEEQRREVGQKALA